MEAANLRSNKLRRLNSLIALGILVVVSLACRGLGSKAKGKASDLKCEAEVGIVKGEMDAGVKVSVVVKNVGDSGFITIKPEISTSEGEWTRSQDVTFTAGESKSLTYFFEEPTINATNIQCRVGVFPNADR
jgi:hypothetical protein